MARIDIDWYKFQSLFALVRLVGGGAMLAWALQSALTVAVAIVLIAMWRSRQVAFELKAAGLAVGILLATPYVYLYDLAILAVSGAFLVRLALKRGFGPAKPSPWRSSRHWSWYCRFWASRSACRQPRSQRY